MVLKHRMCAILNGTVLLALVELYILISWSQNCKRRNSFHNCYNRVHPPAIECGFLHIINNKLSNHYYIWLMCAVCLMIVCFELLFSSQPNKCGRKRIFQQTYMKMQHMPSVFVVAVVVLLASFSVAVTDAKRK